MNFLLNHFRPIYYTHKNEKIHCLNGIGLLENNSINYDDTILGYIKYVSDKKYLYYYNIYIKDGGKNFLCFSFDSHPLDIEGIVVELDIDNEITGVLYQPHLLNEHFWIRNIDDLNKICDNNRVKVYVSKDNHAPYPIGGTIYRHYCFANDICGNIKNDYTVISLNNYLINQNTFNKFYNSIGFPNRLGRNIMTSKTLRLKDIKYKLLIYKFWKNKKTI
jgi:hypothetical protein